MSSAIDFHGDAMECLHMAERAKGAEEKSVLQCLARAWITLGEQFERLHEKKHSQVSKPSVLD
jgi:hypothetical protein